MLKWHKNYYRGTSIKNISKIRLKLIQGKPVPGIYLITLSENPHNQLEILPALTLVQETAARICPEIVGIAKGKEEALELITDMVQTIYEETGELNIKEYSVRSVTGLPALRKQILSGIFLHGHVSAGFLALFLSSCNTKTVHQLLIFVYSESQS